ncbi:MAG TPA: FxsA family protein [Acidimicrobiales bacterium]
MALLVLVFLVFPIAELAVLISVGRAIGVLDTIGLLILVSAVGAWLAKHQGTGVLARIRAALDRGEMPSREVADGFLVLLAGALMIAPGFISDCLAILLLLPPTRAVVRRTLLAYALRRGRVAVLSGGRASAGRGRIRFHYGAPGGARRNGHGRVDGDGDVIWDVESWEEPPRGHDELEGGPR